MSSSDSESSNQNVFAGHKCADERQKHKHRKVSKVSCNHATLHLKYLDGGKESFSIGEIVTPLSQPWRYEIVKFNTKKFEHGTVLLCYQGDINKSSKSNILVKYDSIAKIAPSRADRVLTHSSGTTSYANTSSTSSSYATTRDKATTTIKQGTKKGAKSGQLLKKPERIKKTSVTTKTAQNQRNTRSSSTKHAVSVSSNKRKQSPAKCANRAEKRKDTLKQNHNKLKARKLVCTSRAVFDGKTKLPKEFDVEDSKNNSESNKRFSVLKSSKHVHYKITKGNDKLSAQVEVLSCKGQKVVVKDSVSNDYYEVELQHLHGERLKGRDNEKGAKRKKKREKRKERFDNATKKLEEIREEFKNRMNDIKDTSDYLRYLVEREEKQADLEDNADEESNKDVANDDDDSKASSNANDGNGDVHENQVDNKKDDPKIVERKESDNVEDDSKVSSEGNEGKGDVKDKEK